MSEANVLTAIQEFLQSGHVMEQLMPFLLNVAIAALIYVVGSWVARKLVKVILRVMELRGTDAALNGFTRAVLGTVFRFVLLILMLEQVGINTTSLLALLGAAGLAVGLALKDSLSNFASGVMLILLKPFKVGDFIEAAGIAGVVDKVSVFNTVLVTGDNKEIIVPNAQIYQGTITNYSARALRRIDLIVGISYDDNIKKAKDLILQVIVGDERYLTEPEPVVAVAELADSSVNLVVRAWVKTPEYWPLRWHLLEQIKATLDDNGVTIPFPQRDVHIVSADAKNAA